MKTHACPTKPGSMSFETLSQVFTQRSTVPYLLSPRRCPAIGRSSLPLIALLVVALTSGCRSLSTKLTDFIGTEQFAEARALLEEKGLGFEVSEDADEEGLNARMIFEKGVLKAYRNRAGSNIDKGLPRAAAATIREGLGLCPWSTDLKSQESTYAKIVAGLDHLQGKWNSAETAAWKYHDPSGPREALDDLNPISGLIADSPSLIQVRRRAFESLADFWVSKAKKNKALFSHSELLVFYMDLKDSSIGAGLVSNFKTALHEYVQIRSRKPTHSTGMGALISYYLNQLEGLEHLGKRRAALGRLTPLLDLLNSQLRDWGRTKLTEHLQSVDLDYTEISIAEDLATEHLADKVVRHAVGTRHLRRAERLGKGGAASLLAAAHLRRSELLGCGPSDPEYQQIRALVELALQTTSWPEITVAVDIGIDVNPELQDLVTNAITQEALFHSEGWATWKWAEGRSMEADVWINIRRADLISTPLGDLRIVSSTAFSHYQTIRNPRKDNLESQVNYQEISVSSAKSHYESKVRSHNSYPTQYSLNAINYAYSSYASAVNTFNTYVAAYNSCPSTIQESVYLPYTYREGTVKYGWALAVDLYVAGKHATMNPSSINQDFVRLGTKSTDKTKSRRRDDRLDLDTSGEAGLQHLLNAVKEVRSEIKPMLGEIYHDSVVGLSGDEEQVLAKLLHPWGANGYNWSGSENDKWIASILGSLDKFLELRSPPVIAIERAPESPPTNATPQEIAAWYGPITCQTRASRGVNQVSTGSGVIISGDGLILTCAHVLQGPDVTITISEGPWAGEYPADPFFVNEEQDLALLKARGLNTTKWAPIRLTESAVRGEPLVAMGNPGLQNGGSTVGTVSAGIVANPKTERIGKLVLLADVTIASGSSGGPLIGLSDGKIIGIVQAVLREGIDRDGVSSSGFSCLAGRANALKGCLGLVQQ
jgi:S1-C subfamily serine protease